MTTPTIADYLKYANLQTAAEAFLVDGEGKPLTGQPYIDALIAGNLHTSKFTATEATKFADHWIVLDQCANTETGFSGTLFRCIQDDPATGAKAGDTVMSFRSTEFIDDAVRDSVATNTFEIKNTGFAWGQMADMEAWYAELQADPNKLGGGQAFSVTGYSLGGNLATAFNQLHPGVAQQVVTFNGAGVGKVTQGTLQEALDYFVSLRNDPSLIDAALFTIGNPDLVEFYQTMRTNLGNGTWTVAQAKTALTTTYPAMGQEQLIYIRDSLDEIDTMIQESARLTTLHAGGTGDGANATPKAWDASLIAAETLDYRMAVKLVAQCTESASTAGGAYRAIGGKHQPLYRGGAISEVHIRNHASNEQIRRQAA